MGFGILESSCQCCVTLGHFIHLSEPLFLPLCTLGNNGSVQCAGSTWKLLACGPVHVLGEGGPLGSAARTSEDQGG